MDEEDGGADSERADTYHSHDLLQRITHWASALSWVFFALGGVFLIVGSLIVLPLILEFPGNLVRLLGVFSPVLPLLAGLVSVLLGVMSRAIEQGLFLLMDIEENTWRVAKKLAATTTASDSTRAS